MENNILKMQVNKNNDQISWMQKWIFLHYVKTFLLVINWTSKVNQSATNSYNDTTNVVLFVCTYYSKCIQLSKLQKVCLLRQSLSPLQVWSVYLRSLEPHEMSEGSDFISRPQMSSLRLRKFIINCFSLVWSHKWPLLASRVKLWFD